jgi:organic hydroperoxide reductase OsmC/OhrA
MADQQTYHVSVKMQRGLASEATFDDLPAHPTIRFDEPPPAGEGTAPNAAAVLTAAVANCLSASLAFCLRRARVEVDAVTANAVAHVARNEHGRLRIERIDVAIAPVVSAARGFDRCAALFEDFCTVTSSVRQGIPVHVTLERRQAAADAA